jgi:hypothetical protein
MQTLPPSIVAFLFALVWQQKKEDAHPCGLLANHGFVLLAVRALLRRPRSAYLFQCVDYESYRKKMKVVIQFL